VFVVGKIIGILLIISGAGLLIGAMGGKEVSENVVFSILFIVVGIILMTIKKKKKI